MEVQVLSCAPSFIFAIWLRGGGRPVSGLAVLAAAHLVFFFLQFGLKFFALVDQLVAQGRCLFKIIGGLRNFAVQGDFAAGDFGGVLGIQFRQLLFLRCGELGGGRGFVQALHREFVGGFHGFLLSTIHLAASTLFIAGNFENATKPPDTQWLMLAGIKIRPTDLLLSFLCFVVQDKL
ncbi:MAG TPA: hypothetical protein VF492_09945 [Verrucomicrobiae bacterium]